MPMVNTKDRSLQVKIVYYGPGLSGKTTNLEHLAKQLDPERTGELMSLDTTGDRTLFFDWMPFELGKIKGFDVKVQLFTVPGQVRYNATRKQVLSGADGLVFVADSQAEAVDQNRFAFQNMRENLAEAEIDLEDMPLVIQWNKRDLPSALDSATLSRKLNLEHYPSVEAVASRGAGVVETLRQITRLTLNSVRRFLDPGQVQEAPNPGPLDGHTLMNRIMSSAAAQEHQDVPDDEDLPEILEASEAPAAPAEIALDHDAPEALREMARKFPLFERELRLLNGALRGVYDKLPGRVADAVEREVEPTMERVADVESRLEIMQRAIGGISKRLATMERRLARLELQEHSPGGNPVAFAEMGRLFEELASLMQRLGTTPGAAAAPAGQGEAS